MVRTPGLTRGKYVVAEHGPAIAAVLTVVGLFAVAGAGWIYLNPPTTTVADETNEQRFASSLETSAIVTGDSDLYDKGNRVRNQPVYFTETMPNLTLTVESAVPNDRSVEVSHRLELSIQATRDGEPFWERSSVLLAEETTTGNGTVESATVLNVPKLRERLAPVRNEIGSAGSVSVAVELTMAYESDSYSGTIQRRIPLQLSDRTYVIKPISAETRESTSERRTVTVPRRSTLAYQLPAGVGTLALLAAGVVVGLYYRREQWGAVEEQVHQDRYAEWISVGALGENVAERSVAMESIEDVVDVAIDMDKRVIYDPFTETHAVIDGDVLYYHGRTNPIAESTESSEDRDEPADPDTAFPPGDDTRP